MAAPGALAQRVSTLSFVFLLFGYLSVAVPYERRLVCWQAIMNCHAETQCSYAYEHYTRACSPVLTGERKKCPSHCIASLIQLNMTRNGPALEGCHCGRDATCLNAKRAIEPCLPRTTNTGCTEARRQCEKDQQCSSTMQEYLHHCGKLFSGTMCTNGCRNVIEKMRKIPKGQQLETCVCDGMERTICEYVKSSMKVLCLGALNFDEYSGDDELDQEYDDDSDSEFDEGDGATWSSKSGASLPAAHWVLTPLASILALLPLI